MREIFLDSGIFIKIFDNLNLSGSKETHEEVLSQYHTLKECSVFLSTHTIVAEALNYISNQVLKSNSPYSLDDLLYFNANYIEANISIIYPDNRTYHPKALQIIQDYRSHKFNYIDAITLAFIEDMGGYQTFTLDEAWQYFMFFKGYEINNLEIVNI